MDNLYETVWINTAVEKKKIHGDSVFPVYAPYVIPLWKAVIKGFISFSYTKEIIAIYEYVMTKMKWGRYDQNSLKFHSLWQVIGFCPIHKQELINSAPILGLKKNFQEE